MKKNSILLGVLGGLGPMSTVYFCESLIAHTKAQADADHIDMIVSSRATTPDRTAFILGKSTQDPLPVMIEEAKRLSHAGADLLVIPCNTAHYFYDGLQAACEIPILNIIRETVAHLKACEITHFGLLATEGTGKSGAYHRIAEPMGMRCELPTAQEQEVINSIIFDRLKQNKPVKMDEFYAVADALRSRGCQRLVLGCTELSLLKKSGLDDALFLDALEVLVYRTILACKKEPIGFGAEFAYNAEGCPK